VVLGLDVQFLGGKREKKDHDESGGNRISRFAPVLNPQPRKSASSGTPTAAGRGAEDLLLYYAHTGERHKPSNVVVFEIKSGTFDRSCSQSHREQRSGETPFNQMFWTQLLCYEYFTEIDVL